MHKLILVTSLVLALSGCSAAQKKTKSAPTTSTNSFTASAKQVQQDLTQTETDRGKLESEANFSN